jgi:hypothetical protein
LATLRARLGYDERVRVARGFLGLLLASAAGFVGAHCSVYDTSLLAPEPSRPAPKGGVGWWSGPGDRGCDSARMPTPDDRPAPGSDKVLPPIYLAIQSTRLGSLSETGALDNDAWQEIGFDLDGVCTGVDTCEGDDSPPSCNPTVPQISTDGRVCRDNTFGRLEYAAALVPELSKTYGLNDDAFNCALCVGDYNFLFRISGYNGEPNDDQVRVDLYPSPGLDKPLPWNCADPSWKTRPCFTPEQQFQITPDSMNEPRGGPDLADAKIFDAAAYVREGYLIVRFPDDTHLWFPGYKALVVAYPITLQKGIVAGKIQRDPDGVWRITDGTIGGRVKGTDLITGFRELGLCEADPNYSVMADFVNKNLDVLVDGRRDATATCDGMSLGIAFKAQQVVAGKLMAVEPLKECILRGTAVDGDGGGPDGGGGDGG